MSKQNNHIEVLLRDLPEAANTAMSGLTATPFMKAKIDRAVAQHGTKRPFRLPRWAYASACAALALVMVLTVTPMLSNSGSPGAAIVSMNSGTLGEPTEVPVNLSADLGGGNVFITEGRRSVSYRSIWSDVKNGSFPLIGVNGKYYRMLTTRRSVEEGLIGSVVGEVSEYTTEPSLSGTDGVISNVAPVGTQVKAVSGMGSTLVTAKVDGVYRLFQRVSFNGHALRGSEKLADTLQLQGHVVAMELTGVGTVTDPETCESLLRTLLTSATYESSGSISSKSSLLIETDNGLVVQMSVRGDQLAACGVWSCPEFLEAFEDAVH